MTIFTVIGVIVVSLFAILLIVFVPLGIRDRIELRREARQADEEWPSLRQSRLVPPVPPSLSADDPRSPHRAWPKDDRSPDA